MDTYFQYTLTRNQIDTCLSHSPRNTLNLRTANEDPTELYMYVGQIYVNKSFFIGSTVEEKSMYNTYTVSVIVRMYTHHVHCTVQ